MGVIDESAFSDHSNYTEPKLAINHSDGLQCSQSVSI